MRRQVQPPQRSGDKRERIAFLLLPMEISGERRWLEIARWEEEYRYGPPYGIGYWERIAWLNH